MCAITIAEDKENKSIGGYMNSISLKDKLNTNYKIKIVMKTMILAIALMGVSFGVKSQTEFTTTDWHTFKKTNGKYIKIGGSGTIWAKIVTNRQKFIFNKDVYSYRGGFSSYGSYDLRLKTNGTTRMIIEQSNGNVGIGTTDPGAWKLAVNGKIRAKEVKVETGWADFVFEEKYELPSLTEVEDHIKEKGHLKDIPSAEEVAENGIFLGEMDAKLLQKIEELTLYTIDQQKEIETLRSLVEKLIEEEK